MRFTAACSCLMASRRPGAGVRFAPILVGAESGGARWTRQRPNRMEHSFFASPRTGHTTGSASRGTSPSSRLRRRGSDQIGDRGCPARGPQRKSCSNSWPIRSFTVGLLISRESPLPGRGQLAVAEYAPTDDGELVGGDQVRGRRVSPNRKRWRIAAYDDESKPPAVTDIDGRFTVKGIGADHMARLELRGETIAYAEIDVVNHAIEPIRYQNRFDVAGRLFGSDFTYQAAPTQPLMGTVRDAASGAPLAGVSIESRRLAGAPGGRRRSRPHADRRPGTLSPGRFAEGKRRREQRQERDLRHPER